MYTNTDYTEMLLIYGEARKNAGEDRRLYQQRFPNKCHPAHTKLSRMERYLREAGSLSPNKHLCGRPRRSRTPEFEEAVIQHFEEQPDTSTRSVAHNLGVKDKSIWHVLHDAHFHSHHH
jgi:hypothetical protein